MSEICLEFQDVEKRFGSVQALKRVSFNVSKGEIFGFIGPNGSGKTTAIRIVLDYLRPDSGVVRVFGHDPAVKFSSIGPRVGVMLEQPGLHDYLTAEEYLEFYAGLFDLSKPEAATRCHKLLQMMGLSDRAGDLLRTYSKGMRQRVAFARALLNQPRLLILDEPFDGIDAETRRDLLHLIPRVAGEQGTAVLLTSHNLAEVEQVCHRVAVVKEGRILACDRTDTLRRSVQKQTILVVRFSRSVPDEEIRRIFPNAQYVLEGDEMKVEMTERGMSRDEVLRQLLDNGVSVAGLREEEMTLEDVYFTLTSKDGGK